jgi:hypothetical protein
MSASQPSGVVVIERLPASTFSAPSEGHGRDATLAEFLAYLTEPDAGPSEPTPSKPVVGVNRLRAAAVHASPVRSAELPKLAAELDDAWRQLRRRIQFAARLSA